MANMCRFALMGSEVATAEAHRRGERASAVAGKREKQTSETATHARKQQR